MHEWRGPWTYTEGRRPHVTADRSVLEPLMRVVEEMIQVAEI